jgi:eukaryotic-like serine/threonine-protein kinase
MECAASLPVHESSVTMQLSESPTETGCPSVAELQAFDQGYLPELDINRVASHLDGGCRACAALIDGLGNIDPFAADLRSATAQGPLPDPHVAGRYRVGERIGQGGMGVVYRATEEPTGRIVALKRLTGHLALTPLAIARFRHEVTALARVEHPNVVRLYDFDLEADPPFLVMEFVDGESLAKRLNGKPLPAHEAATLMEKVAGAVQAVHEAGLLHRDLKPGNILLTRTGDPKVSDFGLARGADEEARLTKTGATLGTPEYMPPEQARGSTALTPATDVYALGATLYELLTGRPPFVGPTEMSVLDQVIRTEPLTPTRLQPKVPRDLETICLKCLEKDPTRRYATARAVADELHRFLAGVPILARPIGSTRRAVRKMARHKLVSGMAAAVVIAIVGGGVYSTFRWFGERKALQESESARHEAERTTYNLLIRDADSEWLAGRAAKGLKRLEACPPELRGWEWQYLVHRTGFREREERRHPLMSSSMAMTPDGSRLRFSALDGQVHELAVSDRTAVMPPLSVFPPKEIGGVFSRSARRFAFAPERGKPIFVWDLDERKLVQSIPRPFDSVYILSLSNDGSRLAAGDANSFGVWVWDVAAGTLLQHWEADNESDLDPSGRPTKGIRTLAFSTDGRRLAAGTRDRATIWEIESGKKIAFVPAYRDSTPKELHAVQTLAFVDPVGNLLITGGQFDPRVPERAELLIHDLRKKGREGIRVVANDLRQYEPYAVSRDGTRIAFASGPGMVTVRDLDDRHEVGRFRPNGKVLNLAFVRDDRELLMRNPKGIELWNVARPPGGEVIEMKPRHRTFGLTATKDGQTVLFVVPGKVAGHLRVCVWDRTGGPLSYLPLGPSPLFPIDLAMSPDGHRVAVAMPNALGVQVWDWRLGKQVAILTGPKETVTRVAFTPDGHVVASAADGVCRLWDVANPNDPLTLYTFPGTLIAQALSPEGDVVAIGGSLKAEGNEQLILVHIPTRRITTQLSVGINRVSAIAFQPGSRRLAISTFSSSTAGASLEIWDPATGTRLLSDADAHDDQVTFILFSDTGKSLFTGSRDGAIKVWDPDRCTELLTLAGHTDAVNRGVMLPNGLLFTSSWDGTVRVWDGRPVE